MEHTSLCCGCGVNVEEPFIRCVVCFPNIVRICIDCFSKGLEFGSHESNHEYSIINSEFSLFEDNWSASEELKLLDIIADHGIGNWSDVSLELGGKSEMECEEHYRRCYIISPHSSLPKFPESEVKPISQPIIFKFSDDPPRPKDGSSLSVEMAGYSAARGDLAVERDNFAELDLNSIETDDSCCDELDRELRDCVLSIYWTRIRERQRRKEIVRRYGLINLRKTHVSQLRYQKMLGSWVTKLSVFMHLLPPEEFVKYMELRNYEKELKETVSRLKAYRRNGVTNLSCTRMFEILASRRAQEGRRHLLRDILEHIQDESASRAWLQTQCVLDSLARGSSLPLPALSRKSAPPLNIVGLPGCEKLTDSEKELCARVRLVPNAYVEFRTILERESARCGSLKLAQARTLLKIDVNKTRKIYDFLVSHGSVTKDAT